MRSFLIALLCLTGATQALAQSPEITPQDTTQTVIAAMKGKHVTLRLRSGQELGGKVGETTAQLIVLQAIDGREFFDAVIPVDAVEAVVVRTRK